MRRVLICLIALATLGVAGPAYGSAEPVGWSFDDIETSVHRADIEAIARAGITRGCNPPENTLYCPTDTVTRGQMAAFLARVLDLPPGPDAFVDDDGSVFEDDINSIASANVTRGCNPPTNDRFCPADPVTRGQMAAFLVRGFALPPSAADTFVDDDGNVFEDDIQALAAAGVTLGCNPPTNDRFCPNDLVTREQMASFLVRAVSGLEPYTPTDPADWYLHANGVGDLTFGMETEIALLEFALLGDAMVEGDPDDDTGWIDSFSVFGTCPGSEIRVVRWGNLEVFFTRDSMIDPGEFFTYVVVDEPSWTDLRLRTTEGLRAGDTVAEMQAMYGARVELVFVEPFGFWLYWIDGSPPASFLGLGGSVGGDAATDTVITIEAGQRCGE